MLEKLLKGVNFSQMRLFSFLLSQFKQHLAMIIIFQIFCKTSFSFFFFLPVLVYFHYCFKPGAAYLMYVTAITVYRFRRDRKHHERIRNF